VYDQLLDEVRQQHARAQKSPEWQVLETELRARGIDTTDFGIFSSVARTTFDAEAAAPLLVEWLPRMRDPVDKEVIARTLTGTKRAAPAAARAILAEFRIAPLEDETTKWAYANALSTLADAELADDLIELVRDPRHGRSREMLCDALKRTKDPRAPDVLIGLIDDDEVAGHAILALRTYGPKSSLPHLRRAGSKLAAVLERPTATPFAKRQARKALERISPLGAA
jgi:HEAT repeat protein